MLGAMSDPQHPHPQVPPYAGTPQPTPYPGQPGYDGQPGQPANGAPGHGAQPPGTPPPSTWSADAPQPAYGYAAQGQPAPGGYPATYPAQPGATNTPGRAGMIVGLAALALGIVLNIAVQLLYYTDGWQTGEILTLLNSVVTLGGGIAALVLGLIGLRRKGAPHAAAGIATGLGIAAVVSALYSLLVSFLYQVLYYL